MAIEQGGSGAVAKGVALDALVIVLGGTAKGWLPSPCHPNGDGSECPAAPLLV